MKPSEEIRQHVIKQYIVPARSAGKDSVTVRAGEVHAALHFKQRSAAVCSVLGSLSFQEENGIKLLSREGPGVGMSTLFTFRV